MQLHGSIHKNKRNCAAKYGAWIRSLDIHTDLWTSTNASLIAQQKMAELTSTESCQDSCYTTRTTSMSASTSCTLEQTQSHESETDNQVSTYILFCQPD